jgi:hypothetical protein
LELQHCHGYAGHNNAAPNLFLTYAGHLVYYAAALGVVSTPHRTAATTTPPSPSLPRPTEGAASRDRGSDGAAAAPRDQVRPDDNPRARVNFVVVLYFLFPTSRVVVSFFDPVSHR